MDAKIPEWIGDGKSNTPLPLPAPKTKRKRNRPPKITLQRVKAEWESCTIIDAFDPVLVDWLISRVVELERRLAKHREGK